MPLASRFLPLALPLAIAACSQQPAETTTNTDTATVVREEVAAPTPAAAPTAAAAIQTQPGPDGAQVALNKVAVNGDIMTVTLTYSGGKCCAYAPLSEVSVIDDATSQRISVLKDNAGNWMAAPIFMREQFRVDPSTPNVVWFKFPAPPATTKTVSLTIPTVAPFDAVPVTR